MTVLKNPLITTPYLIATIATLTMLVSPLVTLILSVLIWLSGSTIILLHRQQRLFNFLFAPVFLYAFLLEQWYSSSTSQPLIQTILVNLAILGIAMFSAWVAYQLSHDA
ncbi:hypothetical protein [Lactiplantibacillus paraplantarum]|uniref:hypothetical protein n=1 Tax=Lactiplantibacillus paraplantarum TaxID=60520 RepID=UPI0023AB0B59|nr:hypothetical protein [Lactiplantibacillus paraplantarum]WEE36210.1 hypothetical protein PWO93_01060 [Lactiplantibacillus paraplantarum]